MATLFAIASNTLLPSGRISRRWFWLGMAALTLALSILEPIAANAIGAWGTILLFIPIYWLYFCLLSRRCHDTGRSSFWLLIILVPLVGFVWLVAILFFRRGDPGENQFGADPRPAPPGYLVVDAVS